MDAALATKPGCNCGLCQWARAYHTTLVQLLDAAIQSKTIYKNPNCTINHPGSSCNIACGEY